jgi:hypothetical protein
MVMELLEGETLRERLRSSPLPARKATEYAEYAACGLQRRTMGYRSLRSETGKHFCYARRKSKDFDFGLAKLARLGGTVTSDSETVGLQTEPGMLMGWSATCLPNR